MKDLQIQFTFPVDNPVNNVRVKRRRGVVHIEIPINYPDLHLLAITDLLDIAGNMSKLDLPTTLNNTDTPKESSPEVRIVQIPQPDDLEASGESV